MTFDINLRARGSARKVKFASLFLAFVAGSFASMRASEGQPALEPRQCSGLNSVRDTEVDASTILQACIDSMPHGGILEVSPGDYTLAKSVKLPRGIVIRTQGVASEEPTCTRLNARRCATFRAAPNLGDVTNISHANALFPAVMFHNVATPRGVMFDHIVLDARKDKRGAFEGVRCANRANYSPTVFLVGQNIRIRKSVIRNTFCGSHAIIVVAKGLEITDSIFENAGTHGGPWADGVTVLTAENALVARNQFRNNTDIDLIFGACPNCKVEFNRVTHSGDFSSSSFGSIMLHAWPNTSGDYTGTTVTDNYVDCGGLGCGQAFIVGSLGWYTTQVTRGLTFERNVAANAPAGFVIGSDVSEVALGDNYAIRNVGNRKCSGRQLYDYALAPGSGARFMPNVAVDSSFYAPSSLAGFIPNTDACSPSQANLRPPAPARQAEKLFRFIIGDAYQEILRRHPSAAEVSSALSAFINGGLTESELRSSLIRSPEYLNQWISHKYRLFLKRCPDAWEVASWRDAIVSDAITPAETIRAIAQSPEAASARGKPIPPHACPSPPRRPSTLLAGESLREGLRLQAFGSSSSCAFDAVMQNDGNFAIYRVNRGSTWSTQTARGEGVYQMTLQTDGNLVLYKEGGIPLWNSRTVGSSGSQLILQPDGNLVLYNRALQPVWASGSVIPGCS